jgi:uncharacterized protein
MSFDLDYRDGYGATAANAVATERAAFIRRTYGHLAAAIMAFVAIEAALFASGFAEQIVIRIFSERFAWLILMVAFIGGGFAAQAMARSKTSVGLQYAGLSMYVMLWAVIFLPILYIAEVRFPGQHVAAQAGIVTLMAFGALTAAVFVTGKDFSFLGPFLMVASFAALGLIIASLIFGFSLGAVFAVVMVVLAAGYILYDTLNVMHHYRTTEHVAAALALFASVALMFYYILHLFLAFGGRNE